MAEDRESLTRDQARVLQAVYNRFRESGAWPRFGEIDRQMDRGPRRLDAGQVVPGIPSPLLQPLGSPPAASLEYPMRLTLEGVARCHGSEDDVELFLRALRWMARQERQFEPATSTETASATVDSQRFMRALKLPKSRALDVQRLGAILVVERWGWTSGGTRPDQTWSFSLGRDVRRFRNVQSLDDYRAAHRKWAEETRAHAAPGVAPAQAEPEELPVEILAVNGDYVDRTVVVAIEAKQANSTWQCAKLLQLVAELNDTHARQNPHAAHALLRAIVDHVPPLFGYKDFAEVVNNYSWSGTDKSYMKRLLDTKKQGDEALHRQISKKSGTQLSMEDLPNRRPINRLLEECVTRL